MKVLYISPPFSQLSQKSKGMPIAPPVLEYLAALTLRVDPGIEVEILDAQREHLDVSAVNADLVGISVMTVQAPWAYRTADALRERGIKVVLGGIHVTVLPDEAGPHADAMVLGECEEVLGDLLFDAREGKLKSIYKGGLPELSGMPHPVSSLWNTKYVFGYFQTARGCPHNCAFCSVHKFFGNRVRLRPIDEVVAELAASKRRLFWCIDDNAWGVNIQRSIDLFHEMRGVMRGKWWFGSGDIRTVQMSKGEDLLKSAQRAGLSAMMLGWESNNPVSLDEYRARNKQGEDRRSAIKKIRDHGIDVMLFVVVGGRNDTKKDFDDLLNLCDELKVSAHPVMLTPLPGTELFEQYREYLIEGLDWDFYDGNHAVFNHPVMSSIELEEAFVDLRTELFRLGSIFKRLPQVSMKGFPISHIFSWMLQYPQGNAFKAYAREWKEKYRDSTRS